MRNSVVYPRRFLVNAQRNSQLPRSLANLVNNEAGYCASSCPDGCAQSIPGATTYNLSVTAGDNASTAQLIIPGQVAPIQPVLQTQDGSFVGMVSAASGNLMISFDSAANLKWSVPNDTPFIATANGNVIGGSGNVYDGNGRSTGVVADFGGNSWLGNLYGVSSSGVVSQADMPPNYASTFAACT
jgi:hypothetical protein